MHRHYPSLRHIPFLILLAGLTGHPLLAQNAAVTGQLTELSSATPLAYASVRVLQLPEQKLVGGALTDAAGRFTVALPLGNFTAEIEFIGFETIKTRQS